MTVPQLKNVNRHIVQMLAKFSVIQIFLPGDVLLKQGD